MLWVVVKCQCFQIFGILIRQYCLVLNKKKLLIILVYSSILFSYGYEGAISSLVTVPSPPVVVDKLGYLLDQGYKIVGSFIEDSPDALTHHALNLGVNKSQLMFSRMPGTNMWTREQFIDAIANCNCTMALPTGVSQQYQAVLQRDHPGVRGLFVRDTVMRREMLDTFHGPLHSTFARKAKFLGEAGVFTQILKLSLFTFTYRDNIFLEISDHLDRLPNPFPISEPKISSIFAAWATLLGVAFISCLLEYIVYLQYISVNDLHILL